MKKYIYPHQVMKKYIYPHQVMKKYIYTHQVMKNTTNMKNCEIIEYENEDMSSQLIWISLNLIQLHKMWMHKFHFPDWYFILKIYGISMKNLQPGIISSESTCWVILIMMRQRNMKIIKPLSKVQKESFWKHKNKYLWCWQYVATF